jgi:hypothetical protein
MKTILLLLIAFITPYFGIAQTTFAPVGAKWYYAYGAWGASGYVSFTVIKDTIVNNMHLKQLWAEQKTHDAQSHTNSFQQWKQYIRVQADSVWRYDLEKQTQTLAFAFNLNKGDSLVNDPSPSFNPKNKYVLKKNSSNLINNQTLKVQEYVGFCANPQGITDSVKMSITEHIGPSSYLFFLDAIRLCGTDADGYALHCYEDLNFPLYYAYNQGACDFVATQDLSQQGQFDCNYQSASTTMQIAVSEAFFMPKMELQAVDIYGKLAFRTILETPMQAIDVANFAKGMYVIQLLDNKKIVLGVKKVVFY